MVGEVGCRHGYGLILDLVPLFHVFKVE